jgi:pSer/pThr/pTyr-binding forkhead associated (FHA) protein
VFRDGHGLLRISVLPAADTEVLVAGRQDGAALQLGWDTSVSRLHAEMRRLAGSWMISDLSSHNGTWLNGRRITAGEPLRHSDRIQLGNTLLVFLAPRTLMSAATSAAVNTGPTLEDLSDTQRRVLIALCRPLLADDATPATAANKQIAAECFLAEDTIKMTLRKLYEKFGFEQLGSSQKRQALADMAIRRGLVHIEHL